jgi:hypothetical protein
MTDAEVQQWLSTEERWAWVAWPQDHTVAMLRALAEARRAIALTAAAAQVVDWNEIYAEAEADCDDYMTRDETRAFVLAMPRPVKP